MEVLNPCRAVTQNIVRSRNVIIIDSFVYIYIYKKYNVSYMYLLQIIPNPNKTLDLRQLKKNDFRQPTHSTLALSSGFT